MNASLKTTLKKFGYICLIFFTLFLLLTLSTVLSRKAWTLGLREQIQNTITACYPEETLIVGDAIQIEQPLSVSAAAYKISESEELYGYAVLVRITGIAGPAAALYVRKPSEKAFSYLGIISDDKMYDDSFPWFGTAYRQIDYWKNRIPQIIGEAR